jgi:hypothetical protein
LTVLSGQIYNSYIDEHRTTVFLFSRGSKKKQPGICDFQNKLTEYLRHIGLLRRAQLGTTQGALAGKVLEVIIAEMDDIIQRTSSFCVIMTKGYARRTGSWRPTRDWD